MLKLEKDIFEKYKSELFPRVGATGEGDVSGLVGMLVPDKTMADFSNYENTIGVAEPMIVGALSRCTGYVFCIHRTWQVDNRRGEYLGISDAFGRGGTLRKSLASQERIKNEADFVKHSGLARVGTSSAQEALEFIIDNQRNAFLVLDTKGDIDPSSLNRTILSKGLEDLINDPKNPFIDWSVVAGELSKHGCLTLTTVGWNEEYCDCRLLVVGTRSDVERAFC